MVRGRCLWEISGIFMLRIEVWDMGGNTLYPQHATPLYYAASFGLSHSVLHKYSPYVFS